MMGWEIVCDDVMNWAKEYDGPKFHAVLTDPPYGLEFMGKKWDAPWKTGMSEYGFKDGKFRNVGPVHGSKRNPVCRICHKHQRGNKGCICQKPDFDETPRSNWIKYQAIATEWFTALAEHLLPGGFVMAFASSRGWHRLACALEDAGLIIQPSIFNWHTREVVEVPFCLGWVTGQSFPKASRLDKKLDAKAGRLKERETIGPMPRPASTNRVLTMGRPHNSGSGWQEEPKVSAPATDLARAWEGHRYGGQILKDACTPIVIAYKDLTCEPICDTIVETTFLMEVLLCTHSPVQDAKSLIHQIHQHLQAVAEGFAQKNVGVWVSLKNVSIVEKPSESSQATMTLHDFVVGPALTKDVINQLGVQGGLLARDMLTSDIMGATLQSIGLLWVNILADLLNHGNTFTTSTKINLITDLRILKSYLLGSISAITTKESVDGLQSLVLTVESLLRSLIAKLPLLRGTIATGDAIEQLVKKESDLEVNQKAIAKNELSPIIVAQKPWEGKRLDCIVENGAGALWVDGGRIATEHVNPRYSSGKNIYGGTAFNESKTIQTTSRDGCPSGRWPANFCLIHSEGCERVGVKRVKGGNDPRRADGSKSGHSFHNYQERNKHDHRPCSHIGYADPDGMEVVDAWECVEECPARKLGEQRGESKSVRSMRGDLVDNRGDNYGRAGGKRISDSNYMRGHNDKGTCARFFFQADWSHEVAERIAGADPVRYQPKAAKRERNQNLDNFYWLIDKRASIGFIRIDKAKWEDFGQEEERIHRETGKRVSLRAQGNIHPTCKPISLNKWLATLLLPPKEYAPRRILIPFSGTMSEGIGALLAGWEEVVGIDSEQDYCNIGKARMQFWQQQKRLERAQLSFLSEQKGDHE